MLEEGKAAESLETGLKAVQFYRDTIRDYASEVLLENFAVAVLEVVRKLRNRATGSAEDIAALLEEADEAFQTVFELKILYKDASGTRRMALTLTNWATVARFQENWDLCEKRIRRAWKISNNLLIRANGAFLLAQGAHTTGNLALLEEMRQEMCTIADANENNASFAVALYDCGVIHDWLHESELAVHYFQLAAKHDSIRAAALYMLASLRYKSEDYDAAVDFCELCLAQDPQFTKAQLVLCKASLNNLEAGNGGDLEAQLETLKALVARLSPLCVSGTVFGGETYYLNGKAYRHIWRISNHLGMLYNSVENFRAAANAGYEDVQMYLMLGMGCFALTDFYRDKYVCDLCEMPTWPCRFHRDPDFDVCGACVGKNSQDDLVEVPTAAEPMALLDDCEKFVLRGLQIVEPFETLQDFMLKSHNSGCINQAKDVIARMCAFPHLARRFADAYFESLTSRGTQAELDSFDLLALNGFFNCPDLCARFTPWSAE